VLLLALASGAARAGDLYQWETEDGRIEIGTNPPLGANARPWSPGQETAAQPRPRPAPAAPPAPADSAIVGAPPAKHVSKEDRAKQAQRQAMGRLGDACLARKSTLEKATQKIAIVEAQIARLEKRIEDLEATELAYSRTSCRSDDDGVDTSDCLASTFHRDTEIARSQGELEEAQQKLADLEQRARSAEEDPSCSSSPASRTR
jgi:hypothetical protein